MSNHKNTFTQNAPKFKFKPSKKPKSSRLTFIKQLVLHCLSIPANDLLFTGIVTSLGVAGFLVSQSFIAPQTSQTNTVTLTGFTSHSVQSQVFLFVSAVLSLLFWVAVAVYTHRVIGWLANKLFGSTSHAYLLEITLLLIGWIPAALFLGSYNPLYATRILIASSIVVLAASTLFIFEHLLRSYWSISR